MSSTIPVVTLRNGVRMPMLGYGVFQIPADETERAVLDALDTGYRLLDTASLFRLQFRQASGRVALQTQMPRNSSLATVIADMAFGQPV